MKDMKQRKFDMIMKSYHDGRALKAKLKLTRDEVEAYHNIGKPDLKQDYFEHFDNNFILRLNNIINDPDCNDNQQKAMFIADEISDIGFKPLGLGTNIAVFINPHYSGVVFKFALDECGIADNFNDSILSDKIPRYSKFIRLHPSGLISVQERYLGIKSRERMTSIWPDVKKFLDVLSTRYLISDLSKENFLNYGIGRDGGFIIIDGSDLFPLDGCEHNLLRCNNILTYNRHHNKRCDGIMQYDKIYHNLACPKCGHICLPITHRPNKEVDHMDIIQDGLTDDERDALIELEERYLHATYKELESVSDVSSSTSDTLKHVVPEMATVMDETVTSSDEEEDVLVNDETFDDISEDDETPEVESLDSEDMTDCVEFVVDHDYPDELDINIYGDVDEAFELSEPTVNVNIIRGNNRISLVDVINMDDLKDAIHKKLED